MGRWLLMILVLVTACGRSGPNASLTDVRIQVVDALSGQPIPNAKITLRQSGGSSAGERNADGAGQALFLGVRLGDAYQAFASATGYQSGSSSSFKVTGPVQQSVPLTPIGGGGGFGGLTGSIKDMASQGPLSGVQISLDGRILATSDPTGMFQVTGVQPGPHLLRAQVPGYEVLALQVVVRPGQMAEVETLFMRQERSFGSAGHYLVTLAGARRVVQFDRFGRDVWHYDGLASPAGATRLPDGITLMADTAKRRIIGIDQAGKERFLFGGGFFRRPLKGPTSVVASRDGQTCLVADRDGNKVIELSGSNVVWSYETGLSAPAYATYTPQGGILIVDSGNKRVFEVDRGGQIRWEARGSLYGPTHAQRTHEGRTLVTDMAANRLVEFDGNGLPVWVFDERKQGPLQSDLPTEQPAYWGNGFQTMNWPGEEMEAPVAQQATPPELGGAPALSLNRPQAALRLESGHVMVADTGNDRLILVEPDGRQLKVLHQRMGLPVSIERL